MGKGANRGILVFGLLTLSALFVAGSASAFDGSLPISPNGIALEKFSQFALPQAQRTFGVAAFDSSVGSRLASDSVKITANNLAMSLQDGAVSRYVSDNRKLSMVSGSPMNLDLTARLTRATLKTYSSAINPSISASTVDYDVTAQKFAEFTSPGAIVALIPEPSTLVMSIMGAGLLLSVQRFRKKKG